MNEPVERLTFHVHVHVCVHACQKGASNSVFCHKWLSTIGHVSILFLSSGFITAIDSRPRYPDAPLFPAHIRLSYSAQAT